jgi:hypothetical protein
MISVYSGKNKYIKEKDLEFASCSKTHNVGINGMFKFDF